MPDSIAGLGNLEPGNVAINEDGRAFVLGSRRIVELAQQVEIGPDAADYGARPGASPAVVRAAIQRALNQQGRVSLMAPGVFEIDEPLVWPDYTTLVCGPLTRIVNGASNTSLRNMAVTEAYLASSSSVTITSSGNTATVTWTGHARRVGDWISILGAVESEYNGIFRVESVISANSLTYTLVEPASASPATGTIVAKKATIAPQIIGGIWDYNEAALSGSDSNNLHAIVFGFAVGAVVTSAMIENVRKYAVFMPNVRDIETTRLRFRTPSDGVHLQGCTGALIERLSGYCADDMVSLTCGDFAQYDVAKALHRGIRIHHLYSDNCPLPLLKVAGGPHKFKDIIVDGVYGACGNAIASIVEDTNLPATNLESIEFNNMYCRWGATSPMIAVSRTTTSCNVDSITVHTRRLAPTATQKIVQITNGAATIGAVNIDVPDIDLAGFTSGALVQTTSTGTIGEVRMRVRVRNAPSGAIAVQQDGTMNRVFFSDTTWDGAGRLIDVLASAVNVPDVFANNVRTSTTNNPYQFRDSANFYTNNVRHSGSTVVNLIGPGTVVWEGNLDSANTYVGASGGMVLNVNGQQLAVDAALVTLRAGDMFYNTNAGALTGAGLYGVSAAGAAVKLT